jgi:hypothetical protein
MTACPPAGNPAAAPGADVPVDARTARTGTADARPPGAPDYSPSRRKFSEVLQRARPAGAGAPEPGPDAESLRLAATAARVAEREWSAAKPSTSFGAGPGGGQTPAAAPASPAGALCGVELGEVQAATGRDGAWLRFTIEQGDFAGLRMAFFLRGDVLDVALDASRAGTLDRVRAREQEVREALESRGVALGRFGAEEDDRRGRRRHDREEGEDEDDSR